MDQRILKVPGFKSSGLYTWVFQDRPERGAFNMFLKINYKNQIRIQPWWLSGIMNSKFK